MFRGLPLRKDVRKMGDEFIVPTGKIIKEYLNEYGISQKDLSKKTGLSEKHISHILNGDSRLTEEVALKLEKILPNIPASYWLNLEMKYQEYVARQKEEHKLDNENLEEISKRFRFKEVFKGLNWSLKKQANEMLKLLKISDFSNFDTAYDNLCVNFLQDGGEKEAIAIWMNLCESEIEIQNNDLKDIEYNPKKFVANLTLFKKLAYNNNVEQSLVSCRKLFNKLGVYFVVCDAITNCKVRGVLTTYKNHPVIYISKRFKTHDHIWFAIMHEIGHLIKHYNSKDINISYDTDDISTDIKENEANSFARDYFIEPIDYNNFVKNNDFSDSAICKFSQEHKILDGILVARLQHDGYIENDKLNYKKININKHK